LEHRSIVVFTKESISDEDSNNLFWTILQGLQEDMLTFPGGETAEVAQDEVVLRPVPEFADLGAEERIDRVMTRVEAVVDDGDAIAFAAGLDKGGAGGFGY
jgi:hypothetical protein